MLQRLDGTHGSSRQLGHGIEREVRHEPQHDDLALFGRERVERVDEDRIEWLRRSIGDRYQMGAQEAPALGEPPPFVDEAVMRDGEHPSAERESVASKPAEASGHVAEHLTEQILTVDRTGGAQIGVHRTGQTTKDRLDRRLRDRGIREGRIRGDRRRCCAFDEVHECVRCSWWSTRE